MIRDPSDGSIKIQPQPEMTAGRLREQYGPNWGLKSLDEPKRQPKPAPTKEQLAEHYARFNLGFEPKSDADTM